MANVFETTKDETWEDVGIVNAQVKFDDIWAGETNRVYVAAGNGRLYPYDDSSQSWTPIAVADAQVSLRAFDKYTDQMSTFAIESCPPHGGFDLSRHITKSS